MDQLEEQLIKAQCQDLVLQFALLNDTRQYERLAELFVEDGTFYRPMKPEHGLEGRLQILEDLRRKPENLSSFHVCTNILISVQSATQASGITYFTVYLGSNAAPGLAGSGAFEGTVYVGQYADEFMRQGQRWQFQSRRGRNNFHLKEQRHV